MKQIRECPRSEIIEYIRTQLEQGRIFDASSNLPFDFSLRNVSFYSSVENETVQVLREFSKKYGSVEVSDDLISGVYQLIQDSREQALAERHTSLKSAERRLEDIYHTSEEFGKRKGLSEFDKEPVQKYFTGKKYIMDNPQRAINKESKTFIDFIIFR